jgi:D-sedoheptulose 7-phosphate isomerase
MTTDCLEIKPLSTTMSSTVHRFSTVIENTCITTKSYDVISIDHGMQAIISVLHQCRDQSGFVYIVGNGGSAAIASHAAIDFINMDKMRAISLLDPAVTTCISNDYGYEYVYSKQLTQFMKKEDVLIAISSSGKSQNIINAVTTAENAGAKTITLSGFSENNPLRQTGDYNIWLNSNNYGQVEIGHAFILHYITDQLHHILSEIKA